MYVLPIHPKYLNTTFNNATHVMKECAHTLHKCTPYKPLPYDISRFKYIESSPFTRNENKRIVGIRVSGLVWNLAPLLYGYLLYKLSNNIHTLESTYFRSSSMCTPWKPHSILNFWVRISRGMEVQLTSNSDLIP